jgi:oligopeptide/dipeptide ABC transporter ATP-binding protein
VFDLRGLAKHYPVKEGLFAARRRLRAVDGVDLGVESGQTLALVGESGCGKSTLARLLLRLERPTRGSIRYRSHDLWAMERGEVRRFRREVQMVFQDPYASLNPRMRVEEIVGEGLAIHKLARGEDRSERVQELLELVGLPPEAAGSYPHEFSGGQRQRIGIARALAVEPSVVVADEPLSALDVSVQAQILNLLDDLKRARCLTYVFISHDLRVVEHVSDRVAVMYLGRLVELAPTEELFERPRHPYTRALLRAVPVPDPEQKSEPIVLGGDVPSPIDPPGGCPFHPRCPEAFAPCPVVFPHPCCPSEGTEVACHLYT